MVFAGAIVLGVILRYSLLPYGDFNINGDLNAVGEWGTRFEKLGTKNFYTDSGWEFSRPTYPPISSLMYGFLGKMFESKYVLSQIHNKIKIPPSSFIIDFYASGYNLLLKLPVILADIGVGILIFKIVKDLTKNVKKSALALTFYILNPITIFLSGVWGQTESVIAFFGLASFVLLASKKVWLSIPLFFIGIYIKPTWIIFTPLYLFLLWKFKTGSKQIAVGALISLVIFYITTNPFANGDLMGFATKYIFNNIIPGAKGTARVSISAFNFWTIFAKIDRDFDFSRFLLIPANIWGYIFFLIINLLTFSWVRREKNNLLAVVVGVFTIGLGSFFFMTGMLERYFFSAFPPLVILLFTKPKLAFYLILINITLFLNLIWAFYRRTSDEIGRPFTNNGFLVIKILSLVNVFAYVKCTRKLS